MEKVGLRERRSFVNWFVRSGILLGITLLLTGFTPPASADESINISCYRDARSAWPVGSVAVYNVADAPTACNSLYYDCRGICIGCYHDSDYIDDVCIDVHGNTFLK